MKPKASVKVDVAFQSSAVHKNREGKSRGNDEDEERTALSKKSWRIQTVSYPITQRH